MKHEGAHPSDQQLLLDLEGELDTQGANSVRSHVDLCWRCRARRLELEGAIVEFARLHEAPPPELPSAAGQRALLKARLAEMPGGSRWFDWALTAAACGVLMAGLPLLRHIRPRPSAVIVSVPDSRLTPGATILASQRVVCAMDNTKNKSVPATLQRRVFEEYGIAGAEPRAYEVDYLVTPALGGAEDIRNLWPHSYSATLWNAQVKDALEDRLRKMVCDGDLDLKDAQNEIAANWIAAYKKYFHTDQPLVEHSKAAILK